MKNALESRLSSEDITFVDAFESGRVAPADFHHRQHVTLAYCFLVMEGAEGAHERMRKALKSFLVHHGVDEAKYHETITRAWMLAVEHFVRKTGWAESARAFIEGNPELLDPSIMLTHYSKETFAQPEARSRFVEPDLDPIPRYQ